MARVLKRSYQQPGKLVPSSAQHFKGRSIRLPPGEDVEWHSTRHREEVILVFLGAVVVEVRGDRDQIHSTDLSKGHAAFLLPRVWHRVVNRSRRQARYVYLTA